MRRFLKILLIILVLLIAAAVAVPFIVPADKVKGEVLAQIKASTGRDVAIDRVRFSIFPTLGLEAENVKIGNPDWAKGGDLAEIKTLKIGLELLPLLHHEVKLKDLTLEQPVITLLKRQNSGNWEFGKAAPAASASAPKQATAAASPPPAAAQSPAFSPANLHLDNIKITDGTITYKEDTSDKTEVVTGINLSLKAPDLNEKADITFSASYGGKNADVTLSLSKPLALTGSGTTDVDLKAGYGPLNFTWKGTAAMEKGSVPNLTGKIDIPSLDTKDFSQESTASSQAPAAQSRSEAAPSRPAGSSHWSDAPISFDGLKRAEADLSLSIGKLATPKVTLDDITAQLKLKGGTLQLQTGTIKAYGGTVNLSVAANAGGGLGVVFSAVGTQAEPLLHDFGNYDKLSGTINMQTQLITVGNSQRALVGALSGKGSFSLKDGKIKGVNMQNLMSNLAGAQGSDAQTTAFSELSGTYTVAKGILTTDDLKLLSAKMQMSGTGTVNLPDWYQHFLLKPMLVASQGGAGKEASGITVPVVVDGPLDHPQYRPDMRAALQENLQNPGQLKQNLKDIRKNLLGGGGGLQNFLR